MKSSQNSSLTYLGEPAAGDVGKIKHGAEIEVLDGGQGETPTPVVD